MHSTLTEDQRLIVKSAREFAEREIGPRAAGLDQTSEWPKEIIGKLGQLGFMGVMIPVDLGGAGLDTQTYALVVEELSRACASCGVIMSVNNSLFCAPILAFGTERQKQEILAPAASGALLGCFGLTEPTSGSDARQMRTTARHHGHGWVLNGAKNFITNGPHADFVLVFAAERASLSSVDAHESQSMDAHGSQSMDAHGSQAHTAFLVPLHTPGVTRAPRDHKLGIRAAHSCTILFEDVYVDDAHLLGRPGQGFAIAKTSLDGGRIGIASQAIGIARAAFERARTYALERRAFGKPIAELQAIAFMLADMAVDIEAARLLVQRAAARKDRSVPYTVESAEAKLFASEMATRVTHKAIQIHGGYGYTVEFGVERHYRDARITEIYEGTSEIQRIIIANDMLRPYMLRT